MKNILNEKDYLEIKRRIHELSETNTRLWGEMEIQEMLVHCTRQLKLAVGEISSNKQGSLFLRSKLGKWLLFSNMAWPKGADTPAEMNKKKASFSLTDFETEKNELLNYLEKVRKLKSLKAHPFFGELNRKEWMRLIYKHIDHHLKQFGNQK